MSKIKISPVLLIHPAISVIIIVLSLTTSGTSKSLDSKKCQLPIAFFGALVINSKLFIETPDDYVPANTSINLVCFNEFAVKGSKSSVCTSEGTWKPKIGICIQLPPTTTARPVDYSLFDYAVAMNNQQLVRKLLDQGVDINYRFNNPKQKSQHSQWDILSNGTVLILAAGSRYHTSMLSFLIKRGADVNAKNIHGWSALMWASSNGNLGNMKILLDSGANPNAKNKRGYTPLMFAAQSGFVTACKLLTDYGGQVDNVNAKNWTALLIATRNGHANVADFLLRHGASLAKADNGWTALMHASSLGYLDTVKVLLKYSDKGYINKRAPFDNSTAILLACMNGEKEVIAMLLEHGADANDRDSATSSTCLLHAVRNGWVDLVDFLLVNTNSDVAAVDTKGHNAVSNALLSFSARPNMYALVRMLMAERVSSPMTPPRNYSSR